MLRLLFIDADDEFYLDEEGDLVHRDNDGSITKLVQVHNLRGFAEFITNEADTFEMNKEPTNG